MAPDANAACPPAEADATVIHKGDLALAWRPVATGDKASAARGIPPAKLFALEVQLCDQRGVSAARLESADATMPEHRHGMNYRPLVTPLGAGRFRVEGMMFHMAGRWELVFEVRSGKQVTRFAHDVHID
jgi:hypothetical protein